MNQTMIDMFTRLDGSGKKTLDISLGNWLEIGLLLFAIIWFASAVRGDLDDAIEGQDKIEQRLNAELPRVYVRQDVFEEYIKRQEEVNERTKRIEQLLLEYIGKDK